MDPVVAVQTLLLRTQLPELPLRPGAAVVARVLSRGEQQGVLVIAGVPLTAQLPADVGRTGETLRLVVRDVSPERVTLQLDPAFAAAAAPGPAPAPEPARARVSVEDAARRTGAGGEERSSVALAFHSDVLGRLDLRLEVSGERVAARVQAPAGRAFELAETAAGRLEERLRTATGLPADVHVSARREPLDLYA